MVWGDRPGSIWLALDAAGDAADRLQPAHMGFGKTGAGGRVVTEVDIDVIPSTVGSRDFGHRAIDLPGLGVLGLDAHDGTFGRGLGRFPPADVDIVGAAVGSVDNQRTEERRVGKES